jgi:hypothetical protein
MGRLISLSDAMLASWERRMDELVSEIDAWLLEHDTLSRVRDRSGNEDVALVQATSTAPRQRSSRS